MAGQNFNETNRRLSIQAPTTTEVFSLDDLPDPVAGVITLPTGKYIIKNTIVTSNVIDFADNQVTFQGDSLLTMQWIYVGSRSAFISDAIAPNQSTIINISIVITNNNADFCDFKGGVIFVDNVRQIFTGTNGGLGRYEEVLTSFTTVAAAGFNRGRVFINNSTVFEELGFYRPVTGSFVPAVSIIGNLSDGVVFSRTRFDTDLNSNCFFITPDINSLVSIDAARNVGIGPDYFRTTAPVLSISAFTDVTAFTGATVIDVDGNIVYTTSATHDFLPRDVIINTGFATGAHNGEKTTSQFQLSTTQWQNEPAETFTATDSGGTSKKKATIVTTTLAHGLIEGETVTISGTTNYNGTFTVNHTTEFTFEIEIVFVADDATGTATGIASLDQTDPFVSVIGASLGVPNSMTVGGWFINGNVNETAIPASAAFVDLNVTGAIQLSVNERATSTDLNIGEVQITDLQSRIVTFTSIVYVKKASGATKDYTFKVQIDHGEIDTVAVVLAGTGYVDAEVVTLTGQTSGATNATATLSVTAGAITAINITSGGNGYESGETVDVIGGTGSGGTGTVTLIGYVDLPDPLLVPAELKTTITTIVIDIEINMDTNDNVKLLVSGDDSSGDNIIIQNGSGKIKL